MSLEHLNLRLHPDNIWPSPYETVALDLGPYRPLSQLGAPVVDAQGVSFCAGPGEVRVEVCRPEILRLSLSPQGRVADQCWFCGADSYDLVRASWPQADFSVRDDSWARVETTCLTLELAKSGAGLRLFDRQGRLLLQSQHAMGPRFAPREPHETYAPTFAAFELDADEHFFGFGGKTMPLDRRGNTVDMFAIKVDPTEGEYGGFPVPFFMSNRGYGLFLANPWPHVYFDLGLECSEEWFFHTPDGPLDLYLIHGPEFSDILRQFADLTGHAPLPKRWFFGFWISGTEWPTAALVAADAQRLASEHWPSDVIVLDLPWRGGELTVEMEGEAGGSNFDWYPDFGDGPSLVRTVHDLDYRICLHLNTRNFARSLRAQGLASGMLRQVGEEVVPKVDDPASARWYTDLLMPRSEEGVDLWWTDGAERPGGTLCAGWPSRNLFGVLWNRIIYERMSEIGRTERLVLTRGGGIGGQRYGLPWPGDTTAGVEAMKRDIWFSLNMSLSGYPFTTVDYGGFSSRREGKIKTEVVMSDENICRRVTQSMLLFGVPRVHGCDVPPKLPWYFSPAVQASYRHYLDLRYRLAPYFYSYAARASATGEPMIRPLVYHHRLDPAAYGVNEQLYIGDWLMTAPVTDSGASERELYLPAGRWIDFWSGRSHAGPATITVPAPLLGHDGLPLFIRAGAILPLIEVTDRTADELPGAMTLEIYPDGQSSFDLYEGEGVWSSFECLEGSEEIKVLLSHRGVAARAYTIRVHVTFPVKTLRAWAGGAEVPVPWQAAGGVLSLTLTLHPGQDGQLEIRMEAS